jgi:hypothetical protein
MGAGSDGCADCSGCAGWAAELSGCVALLSGAGWLGADGKDESTGALCGAGVVGEENAFVSRFDEEFVTLNEFVELMERERAASLSMGMLELELSLPLGRPMLSVSLFEHPTRATTKAAVIKNCFIIIFLLVAGRRRFLLATAPS